MTKLVLQLEVKLTAKELQDKGQEMATAMLQYDEYEAEKKAQAKELGAKMTELHETLSKLATVYDKKAEVRAVDCIVELNSPETGTKRYTRLDTKEVFKEEPMTEKERQTNLFDKEEAEEPVTVN